MKSFSLSLRFQLMLWNALTLTALLAVLGVVTRFAAREAILNSVDQQLQARTAPPPHDRLNELRRAGDLRPPDGRRPPEEQRPPGEQHPPEGWRFRQFPEGPQPDRLPPPNRPPHPSDEMELRFFNAQGQPRGPGDSRPWDPAALPAAKQSGPVFSTVTVNDIPLRVLTRPTRWGGFIQSAYPLTEVNRALAGLDRALLLLIPVALLGASLGGALLTARVLRPVRRITQTVAAMGDTPSARLPLQGEDEFAQMADTFNGLLSRLEASFRRQSQILDQQRRFTADASHELKSPLTVIQGTANQITYGGLTEPEVHQSAAEIAGAAASMARLVQDLLLLARSDEGRLGQNRISVLAGEVLAQAIARTDRDGSPILLRLSDEALTLCGNQEELIRLFTNLLQNAAQATPPEGTITVSAVSTPAEAVITVTDTGIGIAPEHLAHLGERFYRTDAARTRMGGGTGLGLSICRGIVEAHQGTLTLASDPGIQTTATVRLPR